MFETIHSLPSGMLALLVALVAAGCGASASGMAVEYAGKERPRLVDDEQMRLGARLSPDEELIGSIAASCDTARRPMVQEEAPRRCMESDVVRYMGEKAAAAGGTRLIGVTCQAYAEGADFEVQGEDREHLLVALLGLGLTVSAVATGRPTPEYPLTQRTDALDAPRARMIVPREQVVCTAGVARPVSLR
ncbi:MAG TPA: hypothetical protein VLS89_18485 [Candidatus Nanopelagicales bacterium]|nr:hypothetical protein [Candidatus Nanopelagicales bacterium]